ncbi:MAG: hypothetical protein DME10_14030 [Candidatus Rokuibacteriota bacterium]|nr:MAG: hypothetical protein DME10_14030 [Candidatus Rokubacteria bacterium]
MDMRLNGTVNIERDDNANYVVTYAPIGVDHVGRPQRRFKGWQHLVAFLQGPLHVGAPEVRSALNALFRNGAFCLDGVWLSEAEITEQGLGPVFCLEAPGGLAYARA